LSDIYKRTGQKAAVLVAYPYLGTFLRALDRGLVTRSIALDSGAFTAMATGVPVDMQSFLDAARALRPDELFGLDVIGDAQATRRNLEAMWSRGFDAIPTFHHGSTIGDLAWALQRDKIAVGGFARMTAARKHKFVQRFAALFGADRPRVHIFGCRSPSLLRSFPFHTADVALSMDPKKYARVSIGETGSVRVARNVSFVARLTVCIETALRLERTLMNEQRNVVYGNGVDIQRRLRQYDASRVIAS
jgi:hypothetical protein